LVLPLLASATALAVTVDALVISAVVEGLKVAFSDELEYVGLVLLIETVVVLEELFDKDTVVLLLDTVAEALLSFVEPDEEELDAFSELVVEDLLETALLLLLEEVEEEELEEAFVVEVVDLVDLVELVEE